MKYVNEVSLYIEKINSNINTNIDLTNFSKYRLDKINKALNDDSKALNIQTELLLQRIFNLDYSYELSETKLGKPYFEDLNYFFNIAHSNDYLVIGTSLVDLGVDIELISNKHLRVAKKLFNKNDLIKYENDIDEIIKTWTIKESYIKLYASTMLIDLKNIIISKDQITGPLGTCYYHTFKYDNYYISVASSKKFNLNLY